MFTNIPGEDKSYTVTSFCGTAHDATSPFCCRTFHHMCRRCTGLRHHNASCAPPNSSLISSCTFCIFCNYTLPSYDLSCASLSPLCSCTLLCIVCMDIGRVGAMGMHWQHPQLPHTSDILAFPFLLYSLPVPRVLSQHVEHSSWCPRVWVGCVPEGVDSPPEAHASPNMCHPVVLEGGPCCCRYPRNTLFSLFLLSGLGWCWRRWCFFTACTPHWLLACCSCHRCCSPLMLLSLLLCLDSFKQLLCHTFLSFSFLLLGLLVPLCLYPLYLGIALLSRTKLCLDDIQGGIVIIRRVLRCVEYTLPGCVLIIFIITRTITVSVHADVQILGWAGWSGCSTSLQTQPTEKICLTCSCASWAFDSST